MKGRLVHIVLFSLLLLGCIVYFFFANSGTRYVNNRIELFRSQFFGHKTAIYLIKEANLCCRPCPKYAELREEGVRIIFIFYPDFSENDIMNFRVAFSVPNETETQIMNPPWEETYRGLEIRNKNKRYSYLLVLSNRAKAKEIWRF